MTAHGEKSVEIQRGKMEKECEDGMVVDGKC